MKILLWRKDMGKKGSLYDKGNAMTFPLELTEFSEEDMDDSNKYLYPSEISGIQREIEDVCDKMEYDGSLMYDQCPDKVSIERIVKKICKKNDYEGCRDEEGRKWLNALVQVMLCSEIGNRRQRRRCHKCNLAK